MQWMLTQDKFDQIQDFCVLFSFRLRFLPCGDAFSKLVLSQSLKKSIIKGETFHDKICRMQDFCILCFAFFPGSPLLRMHPFNLFFLLYEEKQNWRKQFPCPLFYFFSLLVFFLRFSNRTLPWFFHRRFTMTATNGKYKWLLIGIVVVSVVLLVATREYIFLSSCLSDTPPDDMSKFQEQTLFKATQPIWRKCDVTTSQCWFWSNVIFHSI